MGEVKRYTQFMLGLNRMMTVVNEEDYARLEREYEAAQAELTRLRAVEVAAQRVIKAHGTPAFTALLGALAEACGRKG